jgi:hypothetical protein
MLKTTRDRAAIVRRIAGAVLSVALTAGAIMCLRYAPVDNVADHATKGAGRVERTEAGASTPTPSEPTPSEPNGTRPPGSTRSGTGPGLTSPGINLVTTPNADGTFEVSESVYFRKPRSTVSLAAPSAKSGGPPFAHKSPRADLVQISAQNQPVLLPGPVYAYARTVQLQEAVNRIELRYILAGATVRSIPSVTGRALGLLSPLTATSDRTLPVRIEVVGPSVWNLVCPRLGKNRQKCAGTGANLGVAPQLTGATAVVVVQYNLPKPS